EILSFRMQGVEFDNGDMYVDGHKAASDVRDEFVSVTEKLMDELAQCYNVLPMQTHNVNRCGRSRHLARKLSLRRKRSSPNVFEMAATETITSIILIKLIRVSLGTVRHPRRFKIVVIDIQITLKQML